MNDYNISKLGMVALTVIGVAIAFGIVFVIATIQNMLQVTFPVLALIIAAIAGLIVFLYVLLRRAISSSGI